MKNYCVHFGLLVVALWSFNAFGEARKPQQIVGYAFDIDDNLMYLPTKIWIKNTKDGKERGLTTQEYAEARAHLGKEGEWKDYSLTDTSFRDFRDQPGKNKFKEDMALAFTLAPSVWKAPSFDAFIHAMESPATAHQTALITARGHAPASVREGLQEIQKYARNNLQKSIHLPDEANIFSATWPGLDPRYTVGIKDVNKEVSKIKANIMRDILNKIEETPLPPDAFETRDQDGLGKRRLHLWGFSDDDLGNFEKALEVLTAEVKKGKYKNIKITVFFTGTNIPGMKPHAVVIKSDGTTRPAMPDEARYLKPVNPVSGSKGEVKELAH